MVTRPGRPIRIARTEGDMSETVAILAELGVSPKSIRKNWNEARLYEAEFTFRHRAAIDGLP